MRREIRNQLPAFLRCERHLDACQTSLIPLQLMGAGAGARYPPARCRERWYRRLRARSVLLVSLHEVQVDLA